MSYLFKKILIWLAKAQIQKCQPMIIGVTGNAGKTGTKEAIAEVLRHYGKTVRVAAGNLNNEFGFALTILGNWDEEYYNRGSSAGLWLRVLGAGLWGLVVQRNCVEIFLLEYGADRLGDIKRLAMEVKPHIAVVTTVGDMPVHIEFFPAQGGQASADRVAEEKANLVKVLSGADFAVLNYDDSRVLSMESKTKARVITYGFKEGAAIRILDFNYFRNEDNRPAGVGFKIHNGSSFALIRILGSLGKSQAYAAAAAAAAGTILGMDFTKIAEALQKYRGPNGRLKIIAGIKDSTIIDDTYNASPASTRLALETLRDFSDWRRIAVLGDMLELGKHTTPAHRDIGTLAVSCVDILVCVGAQAKFIAEASGISKDKIFIFNNSDEAKLKVRELIHEGDVILVKGSQGMRMEKIVAEIMAEPQRQKELLVRQSERWLSK